MFLSEQTSLKRARNQDIVTPGLVVTVQKDQSVLLAPIRFDCLM